MKLILYLFSWVVFVIIKLNVVQAESTTLNYNCNLPYWNAPAESTDGIFTGDLSLDCSLADELSSAFSLKTLKKKIIEKVRLESVVHQEPASNWLMINSPLTWEVSHHFEEDGNTIQIRELLTVSIENGNQLNYQTRSKEITASGMASYLRSIEFTMMIKQNGNHISVSFRNRVQVKRPWYALDLIFAPIARNICFKKLNQVKEKFVPWVIHTIREH